MTNGFIIPLCLRVSKWCNLLLNISGPSPVNPRCVIKMAAAVKILLSLLLILHYSCGKSLSLFKAACFVNNAPPQATYIVFHHYDSWGNVIVMYIKYIWSFKRGKPECWCNLMLCILPCQTPAERFSFFFFQWGSWLLICCTKARLHVYVYVIHFTNHKDQNGKRGQIHVCGNTFKCLFQIHRMVSFVLAATPGNFIWLQCSSCIQTYVVLSTLF